MKSTLSSILTGVRTWFDNTTVTTIAGGRPHWARIAPFLFLHLGCLGVIWVGWSPVAVLFAIGFYMLRIVLLTGFYHRYFSHRAFSASRGTQFAMALAGNAAVQRGPLWWAAHHRHHHRTSDHEGDPHSPHTTSFLWSHLGWLTDPENFPTDLSRVPDLASYRELRWLDRHDTMVPAIVAAGTFGLGELLAAVAPGLGTSGWQMLVWGFFISTVILLHVSCLVNSVSHCVGSRPFDTTDRSRNNLVIALLTMGEGWHNNHHRYPGSARQGFLKREIDVTYYFLKLLSWVGIIHDLHPVPAHVMASRGQSKSAARIVAR